MYEPHVIVHQSWFRELLSTHGAPTNFTLVLLVSLEVGQEHLIVGEGFTADQTAVSLDGLVVTLRVFNHEIHRENLRRTEDAIHLASINDILVFQQMLDERRLVKIFVGAEDATQTFRLIKLLVDVRQASVHIFGAINQPCHRKLFMQLLHVHFNVVFGLEVLAAQVAAVCDILVLA